MSNYTTYYLGAGASANAIPTVNKFGERTEFFKEFLDLEINSAPNKVINEMLDAFKLEFSPDTLAKKMYHTSVLKNDRIEYNRLKRIITAFLIFEQSRISSSELETAIHGFMDDKKEYADDKAKKFKKLRNDVNTNRDNRYDSFLATILTNEFSENDVPLLNDEFRFISWNYDNQVELSLKEFSKSDMNYIKQYFTKGNRLIKLNGSANIANGELIGFDKGRINEFTREAFKKYLTNSDDETLIKYAWENDKKLNANREMANAIVANTRNLVIIGYSFPYYNRQIDLNIFKSIVVRKNFRIFIQEPSIEKFNEIKELLLDMLFHSTPIRKRVIPDNIIHIKNCSQFYIPM